jgi:hypothetical protein
VTRRRLRAIAEPIRSHYHHQSVLTFDYAARPSASDDAIDVELSGVSTTRLRADCWRMPLPASVCPAGR